MTLFRVLINNGRWFYCWAANGEDAKTAVKKQKGFLADQVIGVSSIPDYASPVVMNP